MRQKIPDISPDSAEAYDQVSAYYDEFTGHHDYEIWLGSLLPALELRDLRGSKLLDLGCGTGKSSLPMVERGWQVTACDNSEGMLQQLQDKAGGTLRTEVADIRQLPTLGEFDLILCLGDVLNYCAVDTPLAAALEGFKRNLAPTGLGLFDLNTIETYRTFYAEESQVQVGDHLLSWKGHGDGFADEGVLASATLEVSSLVNGESTETTHQQRHLGEPEVRASIEQAGLECLDVYGQGFDAMLEKPLDESRHTKAIYITQVCNHKERRR